MDLKQALDFIKDSWAIPGILLGLISFYLALATDEKKRGLLARMGRALVIPIVFTIIALVEIALGVGAPFVLASVVILISGWALWRTRAYRDNMSELVDLRAADSRLVEKYGSLETGHANLHAEHTTLQGVYAADCGTHTALQKMHAALQDDHAKIKEERDKLIIELSHSIPYQKENRGRWDTIPSITIGHIEHYPLLHYSTSKKPIGLGIDLLRKLLDKDVKIKIYDRPVDWKEATELLKLGEFDVVATPLFATFDRSRDIAFSMPLFFSNIGLFASRQLSDRLKLGGRAGLDKVLSAIENQHDVQFITVDQEISEHLGDKYKGKSGTVPRKAETMLSAMFDDIARSAEPDMKNDLVMFSESFSAHLNNELVQTGEVVNLLKPHQILYPVCFALRRCDYQLANLLNIRLLEIAESGGVLADLAKQIQQRDGIPLSDIYDHFVARWPKASVELVSTSDAIDEDSADDRGRRVLGG